MKQDIETLLERYYEGGTSLEEEKLLRQFFQNENLPAHLESHAAQFRYFSKARNQYPSPSFNSQLIEKLCAPERGRVFSLASWGMRIATSLGLVVIGFAGGFFYNQGPAPQPSAEIVAVSANAMPLTVMKKVLSFGEQPASSASERIQAINQSYELGQVDGEITQLLINTLNFDANVNVRLAACQALQHFENEPGVRQALIQSLQVQTDPNIQITLIDALVAIKEKRAVSQMQRLAQNQQLLDVVRLRAKEGSTRLNSGTKTLS